MDSGQRLGRARKRAPGIFMRTIRLRTDWMASAWLSDLPPQARLAWVCLLCHVDAFGKDGVLPMPKTITLASQWKVEPGAVKAMFAAAHKHGAVSKDEKGRLVVAKWGDYQGHRKPAPSPFRWGPAGWENLTPALLAEWSARYSGVNIEAELKKAHAWVASDVQGNKRNDWKRFMQSWFLRCMSPPKPLGGKKTSVADMNFD